MPEIAWWIIGGLIGLLLLRVARSIASIVIVIAVLGAVVNTGAIPGLHI